MQCCDGSLSGSPRFLAFQEDLHHLGVEVTPGLFADVFIYLFLGPGLSIRTVGCQRIENINHGEYARSQRNFFPPQSTRISTAIPLFMVTIRKGRFIFTGTVITSR